jgi:hypothetical protein
MNGSKLINDFLEQETKKIPKLFKVFGQIPEIILTKDFHFDLSRIKYKNKKIIRPSWFYRIIGLFFIGLDLLSIIIVINLMMNNRLPIALLTGFLLFLLFLFFAPVYFLFISKKRNYKIVIDREGLQIDKNRFAWSNLTETAIMILPSGRGHQSYLILVTSDNKVLKFDLFNLSVSDKKLSTIIEYYKNSSRQYPESFS